MKKNTTFLKAISSPQVLIILVIILGYLVLNVPQKATSGVSVSFFDVGQGDSALISTKAGQNVLIDGGPNDTVISKLDKSLGISNRKLSGVVITHPHADHIAGLVSVLDKYQVETVYLTGVLHTTPEYVELLKIISTKNIKTQIVSSGGSIKFDEKTRLDFLYPLGDISTQSVDNLNDSSVVARLSYGEKAVIFMGDLESGSQGELLKSGQMLTGDIIKIAHHGSKDSMNPEFLKAVNPVYAVISAGKDNKFGHPSKEAILSLAGKQILRTDIEGDISFNVSETSINRLDRGK